MDIFQMRLVRLLSDSGIGSLEISELLGIPEVEVAILLRHFPIPKPLQSYGILQNLERLNYLCVTHGVELEWFEQLREMIQDGLDMMVAHLELHLPALETASEAIRIALEVSHSPSREKWPLDRFQHEFFRLLPEIRAGFVQKQLMKTT